MYNVNYLPLAESDLDEIMEYILRELSAPQAAESLLTRIDAVADKLSKNPYIYSVYQSTGLLDFEIRRAPIGKFLLFYTIREDTVDIHRVIYGKRDLSQMITDI